MPTITTARASIYKRMIDNWDTGDGLLTFEGEQGFDPGGAAFVRLSVRHLLANQRTLGAVGDRRFRRPGTIVIQCFAPRTDGGGIKPADVMAALASVIFEAVSFDDIDTYAATPREAPTDDINYIGALVTIPFDYDDIR